jgi:hypothetical protein
VLFFNKSESRAALITRETDSRLCRCVFIVVSTPGRFGSTSAGQAFRRASAAVARGLRLAAIACERVSDSRERAWLVRTVSDTRRTQPNSIHFGDLLCSHGRRNRSVVALRICETGRSLSALNGSQSLAFVGLLTPFRILNQFERSRSDRQRMLDFDSSTGLG